MAEAAPFCNPKLEKSGPDLTTSLEAAPWEWRLLLPGREEARPSGISEAAWNMAVDESILTHVRRGLSLPTLRLYRWEAPAITLGRFQNVDRRVNLSECERRGLTVVRRITGGRGILHGWDLTAALVAPVEALGHGSSVSVLILYRRISEGFRQAFKYLGIPVRSGDCATDRRRMRMGSPVDEALHPLSFNPGKTLEKTERLAECTRDSGDCFASVSAADMVHADIGTKVLGAALHLRGNVFLEQASLPLSLLDQEVLAAVFPGDPSPVKIQGMSDLRFEDVQSALVKGMDEALSMRLTEHSLLGSEADLAQELALSSYLPIHSL